MEDFFGQKLQRDFEIIIKVGHEAAQGMSQSFVTIFFEDIFEIFVEADLVRFFGNQFQIVLFSYKILNSWQLSMFETFEN